MECYLLGLFLKATGEMNPLTERLTGFQVKP
jgi:hypothetical protein